MKILMLVAHAAIQGPIPKITPLLVSSLRELGVEVDTEAWGRHCDGESLLTKAIGRFRDAWRVRRRLEQGRYDLMLVHTSHDFKGALRDIPLLVAARGVAPKIVLHLHGSRPEILLGRGHPLFKLVARATFQNIDGALVLSSEYRDRWRRLYPQKRFHLVSNPYVSHTANQADAPEVVSPSLAVPSLLYVGRIMEPKGVFDLVEALRIVASKTPCCLVIAGTGQDDLRVRERVASLGLTESVIFAGYVTGDDLWSLYRQATIFVLPTRREGFPTVISEAMDAGLPVITTRTGGLADHLEDGVNTSFVAPHDPVALAEAILGLLDDPAKRLAMSRANRAKVRDFSPESVVPAYLAALHDIASHRTGEH